MSDQPEEVADAEVVDDPPAGATAFPPDPAPGAEVAVRPGGSGSTAIIAADSAEDQVAKATAMANVLDNVIKEKGLRTKIGRQKVTKKDGSDEWVDRYHVNIEGWQTLATMLGLAVEVVYSRPVQGVPPVSYEVEKLKYKKGTKGADIKSGQAEVVSSESATVEGYSWEAEAIAVLNGAVVGRGQAMCARTEQPWRERDDFALRNMAQTRAMARAIAAPARWIVTLAGYSGTPAEEMSAEQQGSDQDEAQPFGPPMAANRVGRVQDALQYLLDGGDGSGQQDAEAVWTKIMGEAGDYLPRIVGLSLLHAGAQLKVKLEENKDGGDAAGKE